MTLAEIHKRLRPAFPAKWDAETDALAKSELKSMIGQFGESRTDRAVTEFIRNEQFFSIARLREYVPPAGELPSLYDKLCGTCDDGWEEIGFDQFHTKDKNVAEKLYGHVIARQKTARRRCKVCWKGPVTQ